MRVIFWNLNRTNSAKFGLGDQLCIFVQTLFVRIVLAAVLSLLLYLSVPSQPFEKFMATAVAKCMGLRVRELWYESHYFVFVEGALFCFCIARRCLWWPITIMVICMLWDQRKGIYRNAAVSILVTLVIQTINISRVCLYAVGLNSGFSEFLCHWIPTTIMEVALIGYGATYLWFTQTGKSFQRANR